MSRVLVLVGVLLLGAVGCANAPGCEQDAVTATCGDGVMATCVRAVCDDEGNCPDDIEPCFHTAACSGDGTVVCASALCTGADGEYRAFCPE